MPKDFASAYTSLRAVWDPDASREVEHVGREG